MDQRLQNSVPVGAERHGLNRGGAVAEGEHLLPGEHDANRALEFESSHHGEEELVLGAEARPEGAADEGRDDTDVVARESEDLHNVFLAVLGSLCLVVDRELAVAARR